MKQKLLNFISYLSHKILKVPLGESGTRFVKNIGWFSFGSWGGGLTTFLFTAFTIRFLGPTQYGFANLVFVISNFLVLPLSFSLHWSAMKYLAGAEGEKRNKILATSFWLIMIFILFFSVFFYITKNFWAKEVFGIDPKIFVLGILYTISVILYPFFSGSLRALNKYKTEAIILIASAIVYISLITIFIFIGKYYTFDVLVLSTIARWFFYILLGFFSFSLFCGFGVWRQWDSRFVGPMLSYGGFTTLASISGAFMASFDKLMLNRFISVESLGIYSAYLAGSGLLTARFLDVFMNVFFPTMAGRRDYSRIFGFLKKSFLFVGGLIILISMISILLAFLIYGREFPLKWAYVIIFSVNAAIFGLSTIFISLVNSVGVRGVRFNSLHNFIAVILNVAANIILVPLFGINGAISATVISSTYLLFATSLFFRQKNLFDYSEAL